MLFKDTGYRIFKIEDFRERLDIPEDYRMTNITQKVLTPIKEDFKQTFKDFKIVKIKNGRNIAQIRFNFTYIKPVEVVEDTEKVVNENIGPAGELEQYFKTTFPEANYTVKHRKILENLLKNNSLEYIKQYLKDQWEYTQNDNNIKNKPAYFSKLILEEKAVLKDYLPADYEEKKAEENNRNTKGIISLKELGKDITPEQIEQQVLLKVDVTEEEYNKIKQDWIDKQKEETSNSDMEILETIFNASQSKKYNIIPTKEETKLKLIKRFFRHKDFKDEDYFRLFKNLISIIRKFRNKIAHNAKVITYRVDRRYELQQIKLMKINPYSLMKWKDTKNKITGRNDLFAMILSLIIVLDNPVLVGNMLNEISVFLESNANVSDSYIKITNLPPDIINRIQNIDIKKYWVKHLEKWNDENN